MLLGAKIAMKIVAMTAIIAKIDVQTKSLSKISQLGIYFSSFCSFLGITTPKSAEISSSSVYSIGSVLLSTAIASQTMTRKPKIAKITTKMSISTPVLPWVASFSV
jgi:hypothetical protein